MLVMDRNTVVESAPLYFSGWTQQQKQLGSDIKARQNQGNIEFALGVLRCQKTCEIPRIMGAFRSTRCCRHLSHKAYSGQLCLHLESLTIVFQVSQFIVCRCYPILAQVCSRLADRR